MVFNFSLGGSGSNDGFLFPVRFWWNMPVRAFVGDFPAVKLVASRLVGTCPQHANNETRGCVDVLPLPIGPYCSGSFVGLVVYSLFVYEFLLWFF